MTQRVAAARLQHGAEFLVQIHAGLLPAGMQPEREPAVIVGPQFRLAEWLEHRLAALIEQRQCSRNTPCRIGSEKWR